MSNGPDRSILVVDDDARNRTLLCRALERSYRVIEASSGNEALTLAPQQRPDLVLLDVMMPDLNGFEVCRTLKQDQGEQFLPVVLLTALSEQTDRIQGLEAGADDFLSKPFDRQELLLRVKNLITLRSQRELILQQHRALKELDTLKDDLVALMVHDLRNPLLGVTGFLSLCEGNGDIRDLQENAELAKRTAEQMRGLLDDMLQVRLLEEGRIQLREEATNVRDLVRRAVRSVEGAARENEIVVQTDVPEDLVGLVDANLTRRAVENLLANAIRYARARTTVRVAARLSDGTLVVEVCDAGAGLSDAALSGLFQKFGGLKRRTSERGSMGLGLYLVRLVAEAHGGRVEASNLSAGGASFRLYLAHKPPVA